jgi:hypothetical protein
MYLMIPTWLIFVFLVIASFAPIVSLRPGWWIPYYAGLLACWVVAVIAALRRAGQEERAAHQEFVRALREFQHAREDEGEHDGHARPDGRGSTTGAFRRRGGLFDAQTGAQRGGR